MMKKSQISLVFTFASVLFLGVVPFESVSQPQSGREDVKTKQQVIASQPGEGATVTTAYNLPEERFQTEILNIGLEELGYETEITEQVQYASLHQQVANGDLDYMAVHWEQLHSEFYNKSGGDQKLERIGILVDKVLQGYLIDKQTAEEHDISSLDDLKNPEIAKLFDTNGNGKADLIGCNSGWGCELVIEHHLDEYGLRDTVEHKQGEYSELIGTAIPRFEQGEPILYYTWTPLWVSSILTPGEETIWLEVPYTSLPTAQGDVSEVDTSAPTSKLSLERKNLGFAVDEQKVLANEKFISNNPAAKNFFELVTIPIDDISQQNQWMRPAQEGGKGEDSAEEIRSHAEQWVADNREQFDEWLTEAVAASE